MTCPPEATPRRQLNARMTALRDPGLSGSLLRPGAPAFEAGTEPTWRFGPNLVGTPAETPGSICSDEAATEGKNRPADGPRYR